MVDDSVSADLCAFRPDTRAASLLVARRNLLSDRKNDGGQMCATFFSASVNIAFKPFFYEFASHLVFAVIPTYQKRE